MQISPKLIGLINKLPLLLIASIIMGLVTSSVLSIITHLILHAVGLFPPLAKPMFNNKLLVISLIYHSVYAVVGAFVTAKIAKNKAQKAVFILGSKSAIMWLLGIILLWKHSPPWFNITKAIIGIPLAILGGKIYTWYKLQKNPEA